MSYNHDWVQAGATVSKQLLWSAFNGKRKEAFQTTMVPTRFNEETWFKETIGGGGEEDTRMVTKSEKQQTNGGTNRGPRPSERLGVESGLWTSVWSQVREPFQGFKSVPNHEGLPDREISKNNTFLKMVCGHPGLETPPHLRPRSILRVAQTVEVT